MYNERLEQLIDAALADGELTEKEKQILFKKAQEMGVDLDEFEMVLDARLVKLKKAEEEKAKSSAPKSNKLGDVKKCPNCGAIVQSYQAVCGECGYAFENVEANLSSQKLAEKLVAIDEKYLNIKNSQVNKIEDKKDSFWNDTITKQNKIDKETKRLSKEQNKEKAQVISSFPIPSTKADLLEFISTMKVKMIDRAENRYITDAYAIKCKECIEKAKILFSNDSIFDKLIEEYDVANKKWRYQRIWKIFVQHNRMIIGAFIIFIFLLIFVIAPIIGPTILIKSYENSKAEKVEQLQTLLNQGEIESAKTLYLKFEEEDEWGIFDGRQIMYRGFIDNGYYDEASEYVRDNNSDYCSYMEEVVTILAKTDQKKEAKKFIKRKITYFYKNDDKSNVSYDTYNSKLIEKKLNAIIDNF